LALNQSLVPYTQRLQKNAPQRASLLLIRIPSPGNCTQIVQHFISETLKTRQELQPRTSRNTFTHSSVFLSFAAFPDPSRVTSRTPCRSVGKTDVVRHARILGSLHSLSTFDTY